MTSSEIDISIFNAHILTMNEQLQTYNRGYLLVKDSKILDIGPMDKFHSKYGNKIDVKEEIDAKGDLLLPGFVNSHGHLAMTLFRGIADDIPLYKWLREYIWPIEEKLTAKDCFLGSQLAAIEMIQGGTTTACDMYFHEEKTLDALEMIGFRGVLGYGMIDLENVDKTNQELKQTKHLINHAKKHANLCSIIVSPHAPNTCSDELLLQAKELAEKSNLPIQIHLAETKNEVKEFQEKRNCSPVKHLNNIEFLSDNLLAAHCVWLSEEDFKLLHEKKVNIVHNPSSNLKLGSGIFNFKKLSQLDVNIALGTDGAASNNNLSMIEEIRLASYLQKGINTNPEILPAHEALKMATVNGAQALGLENQIGSLEIEKKADIIIIDTKLPNVWPPHNPYALIAYSAVDTNIITTIIDGKMVMKNRQMLTIDYKEVLTKVRESLISLISETDLQQFKNKLKFL
ncbi:MAG: amidohydrolase [Asgard group archaeon]|nr:amidohydrolase [Asgard group archaeon]